MSAKKNDNNADFEASISRLEEIARLLEGGGEKLTLERSLELYEEGSKLAAKCVGTLSSARQRITELSAQAEKPGDDADD